MRFRLKADAVFEAENIDHAVYLMAQHFFWLLGQMYEIENGDDPIELFGSVELQGENDNAV